MPLPVANGDAIHLEELEFSAPVGVPDESEPKRNASPSRLRCGRVCGFPSGR